MSNTVEIVTYANNIERIDAAIQAGADHLLLEDSQLSIQCRSDYQDDPSFTQLITINHMNTLSIDT